MAQKYPLLTPQAVADGQDIAAIVIERVEAGEASSTGAPNAPAPQFSSRGSMWFSGNNSAPDYFTIPATGLNYPDSDWADIVCVKLHTANVTLTQHIYNAGSFASGTHCSVSLYLANATLNVRIRTSSAQTLTASGSLSSSRANDGGWYYICVRRVGSNVEIAWCPKGGSATTGFSNNVTALAGISLNAGVVIGGRSDATSSNGQNSSWSRNHIAYWTRINGTFSNANLEALAAGQDIMEDLGLSPLCYIKFDTAGATIADSSGNARNATKVNSPALRGGPTYSGAPVTVDASLDPCYGWVWQRRPGGNSRVLTVTGTYRGSPGNILARVIDGAGNVVSAPVTSTYPEPGKWSAELTVFEGGKYTLDAYHENDATKFGRSQMPWGVGIVVNPVGESIADLLADSTAWTDAPFNPDREQTCIIKMTDTWANSQSYTTSSRAVNPSNYKLYRCASNHTSPASGTFDDDLAANPSRWAEVTVADLQTDTINGSVGAILHVLERLRADRGIPAMAMFGAKTGSKLSTGSPTNWDNFNYEPLHTKLKAALFHAGGDVEAMFWIQGANDANDASPPSSATYQGDLEALIPQIRSYVPGRTASQLPVFIPILGTNTGGSSVADSGWRAVRNGLMAAIATITNAFDGGCMHDLTHVDDLHPNAAGNLLMCKRLAQAMLNYYNPATYTTTVRGALVASASFSGSDIDVNFTLPSGATALQGASVATITGFLVRNASAVTKTVSSTSFVDGDTIRLTMGESVGSGWTVDYVATQNPTITNMLYDNRPVTGISGTNLVPVRPFTAPITL